MELLSAVMRSGARHCISLIESWLSMSVVMKAFVVLVCSGQGRSDEMSSPSTRPSAAARARQN